MFYCFVFLCSLFSLVHSFFVYARYTIDPSLLFFDIEVEKLAKRTKKEAKLWRKQQQGQTSRGETWKTEFITWDTMEPKLFVRRGALWETMLPQMPWGVPLVWFALPFKPTTSKSSLHFFN